MDELEQRVPKGLKIAFLLNLAVVCENIPPLEWLNVAILGAFGLTFVFYLLSLQEAG